MTNIVRGKIIRLLSIQGLSWRYIAKMFKGVTRDEVKAIALSIRRRSQIL